MQRRWTFLWPCVVIACTPRPDVSSAAGGLAETEAAPTRDVRIGDRVVFENVRDQADDRVVDEDGVMWRMVSGQKVRVLDGVRRAGAVHPSGVIVVREGAEPGRSSLWLVPNEGAPRVIAPGSGGDDLPLVLPDGRIAFVSTRSSVASVWIAEVDGEARQLTNVGLVAGRPWKNFIPPPHEKLEFADGALVYEDGRRTWRLDPNTGDVESP